MEKHYPENLKPPKESDVLWEKVMQKVDILMANKFDYKKIGEIIRLNDYLKELSMGHEVVLPEPDTKLVNAVNHITKPSRNVQVEFSADEMFARWIYGIIPRTAKEKGWQKAFEMLEQFTDIQLSNINDKKQ